MIPWTSLYTLPVIATLEDVYVLAGPVSDRRYDPEREKVLANATKRQKLEEVASAGAGQGKRTPVLVLQAFLEHTWLLNPYAAGG